MLYLVCFVEKMSYEIFDFRVKERLEIPIFYVLVFLGQHLECRPLDPTLDISPNFVTPFFRIFFKKDSSFFIPIIFFNLKKCNFFILSSFFLSNLPGSSPRTLVFPILKTKFIKLSRCQPLDSANEIWTFTIGLKWKSQIL